MLRRWFRNESYRKYVVKRVYRRRIRRRRLGFESDENEFTDSDDNDIQ